MNPHRKRHPWRHRTGCSAQQPCGATANQHNLITQIAQRLCVSPRTVETHRAQIMDRLNLHDVASLTRFAIRSGLTDSEV